MPRPYTRHSPAIGNGGAPYIVGTQGPDIAINHAGNESEVQQENIRLTQRLAQQAEELTAMRNQLDSLTASSTTAADATQLLTTRTTNAAAEADADLEQARSELVQVREQANRAIATAQRRVEAVTEELRLSKLENEALVARVGQAISAHQQQYTAKATAARDLLREALRYFEG